MEELKNYLLDQISYWSNYHPEYICFPASHFEIETKRQVYQDVLDKLREIERKDEEKEK